MIRSAGLYPKRRILLFGSLVVVVSTLLWQILLVNLQVPVFDSSLYFPETGTPALELTLSGALNDQVQFSEAGQFLEASCHASGFSFSLSPESTPYALSINFSVPMSTRPELAGSYSLVPGFGGMTFYLPASAENPSARIFETQAGRLQASGNQGGFEALFHDSAGASLVASGHWRCP